MSGVHSPVLSGPAHPFEITGTCCHADCVPGEPACCPRSRDTVSAGISLHGNAVLNGVREEDWQSTTKGRG